jgi:hypothetical protein
MPTTTPSEARKMGDPLDPKTSASANSATRAYPTLSHCMLPFDHRHRFNRFPDSAVRSRSHISRPQVTVRAPFQLRFG